MYIYTPTLVWAVTIEMQRTPLHEVGGWGRPPSRGGSWRSDEDASLLARMASVAGFQKRTTSTGTPPAQYSPLLVPLPQNVFSLFFICSFENNETIRVGAQVEIGPMGKAPAVAFIESPF